MATANANVRLPNEGVTPQIPANFDGFDNTQSIEYMYAWVTVDVSPAQYATGGLPLVNGKNVAQGAFAKEGLKSAAVPPATLPVPIWVKFETTTGSGYIYTWNKANNKLQIWTSNGAAPAALAEFTNATNIPAAVSSDVILMQAAFYRGA